MPWPTRSQQIGWFILLTALLVFLALKLFLVL